jgi:hypothetical protein
MGKMVEFDRESEASIDNSMSRTVVTVRHVLFEDLGILAPLLTERGYSICYLDAGIDPGN